MTATHKTALALIGTSSTSSAVEAPQTATHKTALALIGTLSLSGCGLFGAVFVSPGETVRLISASQYEVTYEYTHHYDSELPFAGKEADARCGRYGKHSALKQIVRKDVDRSMAVFRCE